MSKKMSKKAALHTTDPKKLLKNTSAFSVKEAYNAIRTDRKSVV